MRTFQGEFVVRRYEIKRPTTNFKNIDWKHVALIAITLIVGAIHSRQRRCPTSGAGRDGGARADVDRQLVAGVAGRYAATDRNTYDASRHASASGQPRGQDPVTYTFAGSPEELLFLEREGYRDAQKLIDLQKKVQEQTMPLLSDPERLQSYFVGYFRAYLHYAAEPPAMAEPDISFRS